MHWLAGLWLVFGAQTTEFAGYWDSGWTNGREGEYCLLYQEVPGYGTARFLARPGQPLRFELLGHRDLAREGTVAANQVAPAWHPAHPSERPVAVLSHLAGYGLMADDPEASALLLGLYDGYDTELRHGAFYGPPGALWLRLPAMRMRPAYRQFMACWQGDGALGWAELARTRVQFEWDEHSLAPAARARLEAIARYCAADPGISRIYVDGHTDATGTAAYNARLSARRAKVVADLLTAAGVPRARIEVRHHGARYPVADNGSEAGRAENRRTTIRLERDGAQVADRG